MTISQKYVCIYYSTCPEQCLQCVKRRPLDVLICRHHFNFGAIIVQIFFLQITASNELLRSRVELKCKKLTNHLGDSKVYLDSIAVSLFTNSETATTTLWERLQNFQRKVLLSSRIMIRMPEMQKVADAADISVLFFSTGANFWVILGHFWAILAILGPFWANLGNFGSSLGYFG